MTVEPTPGGARSDGDVIVASPTIVGALLFLLWTLVQLFLVLIAVSSATKAWFNPSVPWVMRGIYAFLAFGMTVFFFVGTGFTIRALFLPRPVVRLDAQGILDRRIAAEVIPWSNIKRVTTYTGSIVLVDLRTPIRTDVTSFQVRFWGMSLSRPPRGRTSFALSWSPNPSLPRATIRTLVERHGAEWVHDKMGPPKRRGRWA